MPSIRNDRSLRWLHGPGLPALAALLAVMAMPASSAWAQPDDSAWPREFDSTSGSFVIYQPQPEDLQGDVLTGRAAFSLQKEGEANASFGVLWFTESIQVDRDGGTVTARNFDVTKVRLPGITSDLAGRYEHLVEDQATGWDLSGSLEELQAGLAAAERERKTVAELEDTPPRILFYSHRAIHVVYDGPPEREPIEGTDLERIVNTPFAVVFDPKEATYYLSGASVWYRARNPLGPWTATPDPPARVREIVPADSASFDPMAGPPPQVLTATEPTELIATDGPPKYAPLVGDELLTITNTESDVVREVSTQSLYVLLSGRWFRAPGTEGPWTFVRGDELPASFKQIPAGSPRASILASVAGTDPAEDAIADAEIPQTSPIRRDDQSFEVAYDGDPQFEPIQGTDLQYAVNTDAEVILADGRYYACDQGVWYIADDPNGPWSVSETRPLGVEDIPPSSPVYDVRYVYIYDSTPEVVYVGYLPGYIGCYPYYGTVVYGTGYHYRPWRSHHHYYPRRFTWGFHARYNPWLSRWSFGFSYGTNFLRIGTGWHPGHEGGRRRSRPMWFGPGGYHRPLLAQDMTPLRTRPQRKPQPRLPEGTPNNVYSRPDNIQRVVSPPGRGPIRPTGRPLPGPTSQPNNVFAGKDGKVYQRDDTGHWNSREGHQWKPAQLPAPSPAAPPAQPRANPPKGPSPRQAGPTSPREGPAPRAQRPAPPATRPPAGDLEREYRARERAVPREKPGTPPSAPPATSQQDRQKEKAQKPQQEKPPKKEKENHP